MTTQLDRIEAKLDQLAKQVKLGVALDRAGLQQGAIEMAISDEMLAKITKQGTTLDSIRTLLDQWVADNTISAAARDQIFAALDANQAKEDALEAALQPATPPTP